MMENAFIFAAVIIPIATALIQLLKVTVKLPKNLLPVLSVVISILVAILAYPFTDLDLTMRVWSGLFAGLSATGFFELALNPREGNTK
jgi:hypothetical protein